MTHLSICPLPFILKHRLWNQEKVIRGGEKVVAGRPESVFLDEGQGASGGVSYFANFLVNLDQ